MATEDYSSSDSRSNREGSTARWILLAVVVLAILYAGATVALQTWFDADYIEGKLNEALAASTDSLYQVDLEAVDWTLWRRSLQAEEVALHPTSYTLDRLREAGQLPSPRVRVTAPEIRLQGIHFWALLWNRDVEFNGVTLQDPHVHLDATGGADQSEEDPATDPSPASMHVLLARSLPGIAIEELSVTDGTMSFEHRPNSPAPPDTLWGINARLEGLTIDSSSAQDTSRVFFSDQVHLAVDGYRHVSDDSLYALAIDSVRASSQDSSLAIGHVQLIPTVPDQAFMRRHGHRTDRFRSSTRDIELEGINYWRFLEEQAVLAETARLDSLVIDVYRDNHFPPEPGEPSPKTMPHEAFQSLESAIRLDTIRVTNGYIAYTKRDEDAAEPGTISFEDVSATIYNVTNDPDRMTQATPAVVDAQTRVAGAGLLETTIRLPLLSPHLAFSYQGQVGAMDARALNMAFVDMAGVRIKSGEIDSLWFEADIQRGTATGTFHGIYRNLEVETLDQESGERGLLQWIETLFVNDMSIEPENTPGDNSLRTGTIDQERSEDDSFFKFLWHSLRSGIFSLVGL